MEPLPYRLQRIVAAFLGVGFALQPVSSFADFRDVASSPYMDAIVAFEQKGVLEGYADGTFKPEFTINRAEFLKIVLLSAYSEAEIDELLARVRVTSVEDVPSDTWFYRYVTFARSKGVVEGYPDGLFHPEREINFVEAAKIISLVYQQKSEMTGGEWYEVYARALDGSKAIPTSILGLDKPITRGEMAEMMWRVSENKTDRPSKGYLNVKYPDATVNFASDDVQNAKSCADLSALAEETQARQATMYYGRDAMEDSSGLGGAVPSMAANENKTTATSPQAGTAGADGDYSTTNVQVEGVDEGDIIKTDAEYLFILKGRTVRIVDAMPAANLKEVATIDLGTSDVSPTDLYVEGDRLVVLGQEWKQYPYPGGVTPMDKGGATTDAKMMIAPGYYPSYYSKPNVDVRIYDISNRASPKQSRALSFDGNTVSSRMIGDTMYLVMQQPMIWAYPMMKDMPEADLIPKFTDSAKGRDEMPVTKCASVVILPHPVAPQYITVATIPLDGMAKDVKQEVVVGSAQSVYSSLENLYVAMTEWKYDWSSRGSSSTEQTHVYRFALDKDGVEYKAKGFVPGHILNQFSMDENGSTFRIATTEQSYDGEKNSSNNNLYVLSDDMNVIGSVKDMAPGETIYSVRFMGDRAYVVTFKTVDPLFVIDLKDARNPKILGQLKIPGYSNYLHPYDENHVIGFGKDVDESIDADKVHDDNAVYYTAVLGMKIALFDVTDPTKPKEMSKVIIGDRGTDSPLLYDHKALLFDKERSLFSFPITVTEDKAGTQPSGTETYPETVFQGAYVYTLDLQNGFKQQGTITHYASDAFAKSGSYWYGGERDIQRIVRIGDTLYTISQAAVQANRIGNLDKLGATELKAGLNDNVTDPGIVY